VCHNSRHWLPAKTKYDVDESINGISIGDGTKLVTSRLYEPVRPDGLREEPMVQPITHSSTYRVTQVEQFQTALREVCIYNSVHTYAVREWN
jgi:hypothetical protein